MTNAFDPRIVQVGLEIEGDFLIFKDLDIRITGSKFASPDMNVCTVKISNLTREQRNYILSKATPYAARGLTPIRMTVDVGRQSYGTFRLFEGEVYSGNVTPPPDIGVTLNSLTNSFASGLMSSNSQQAVTQLETVARSIAQQNNLTLNFRASPKQIANFSYTGAISKLVDKLQMVGGVRAWVDNKVLTVINKNEYDGEEALDVNINTGMVGVPQATQNGVSAQILITPGVKPGMRVNVLSDINPSANGEFFLSTIDFEICNRDNPFYYKLGLTNNVSYNSGTT
jgi:hypothetical protein